ncbi:hypothetical protein IKD82_02715 [Candidatus Saccharibacteria bacterium]|nr:hypothetical protein [Candidatus Saccharibacteria bacterium]
MAQKRKRNKKWVYRLLMLVLLIIAGVIVYLVWDGYFNDKKMENNDNQEQIIVEEETSEVKTIVEEIDEEDDKKTKQYEGEDPNIKEELSGSVTFAGKIDERITVRLNIDQYLSDGKCTIHFVKNNNEVYSETTNIISSASTSTCEGFDIITDGFENGKYEIMIDLSSGEKRGIIRGKIDI